MEPEVMYKGISGGHPKKNQSELDLLNCRQMAMSHTLWSCPGTMHSLLELQLVSLEGWELKW